MAGGAKRKTFRQAATQIVIADVSMSLDNVLPRLTDALDRAIELAETGEDVGGAGVLVTGSVLTVAEARARVLGSGPVG